MPDHLVKTLPVYLGSSSPGIHVLMFSVAAAYKTLNPISGFFKNLQWYEFLLFGIEMQQAFGHVTAGKRTYQPENLLAVASKNDLHKIISNHLMESRSQIS